MLPQQAVKPQFTGQTDIARPWWLGLGDLLGDPLAWGTGALVLPLIVLALLLPPFEVLGSLGGSAGGDSGADNAQDGALPLPPPDMTFAGFNADTPAREYGALAITAPDAGDWRMHVEARTPQEFRGGDVPAAGWHCPPDAIPDRYALASDVFSFSQQGSLDSPVTLTIVPRPDSMGPALELRAWSAAAETWQAVPAVRNANGTVGATLAELPRCVALFRPAERDPLLAVIVQPGDIYVPELLPEGTRIYAGSVRPLPDGSLRLDRSPAYDRLRAAGLVPLVQNTDDGTVIDVGTITALLDDPERRAGHVAALAAFAESSPIYDGLALDYRDLPVEQRASFTTLVAELARVMHQQGRTLTVFLPAPAYDPATNTWNTGAYDWAAIGQAADLVVLRLPPGPDAADPDIPAGRDPVAWARDVMPAYRLAIGLDALSVEQQAGGSTAPVTFAAALDDLGSVQLDPPDALTAQQPVTAAIQPLPGVQVIAGRDAGYGLPFVRYSDADGATLRTMWLTDAAALYDRISQFAARDVGGVLVDNLMDPGTVSGVENVLLAYRNNQPERVPALEPVIQWSARQSGDTLAREALPLHTPFAFETGAESGLLAVEARVNAVLVASESVAVTGGSTAATVPVTPFAFGVQLGVVDALTPELAALEPDWIALTIDYRHGAVALSYADLIRQSHAAGAQVLVRVEGDVSDALRYATSDYHDRYATFVAGLADAGADGIETWPRRADIWSVYDLAAQIAFSHLYIRERTPDTQVMMALDLEGPNNFQNAVALNEYLITEYADCVAVDLLGDTNSPLPGDLIEQRVARVHSAFTERIPVCITRLGYRLADGEDPAAQGAWLAEALETARAQPWVTLAILWAGDPAIFPAGSADQGYALVRPDGSCPACEYLAEVLK